jgi:hypothetical protein
VFYPQAVLLDAFHLVTRTADAENALPEPVGGELAPDGAYTLFLPIDPATDEDRYLVIHTVPPAPAPTSSEAWLRSRSPVMRAAFGWRAGASDTGRPVSLAPARHRDGRSLRRLQPSAGAGARPLPSNSPAASPSTAKPSGSTSYTQR